MNPFAHVGQIVVYTNLGDADNEFPPEQQAAVITGVNEDGTVALKIFYRTGIFDMQDVAYSPVFKRRHWTDYDNAVQQRG